jgi:hypothetical protein
VPDHPDVGRLVTWAGARAWRVAEVDDSGCVRLERWVNRNDVPELSTLRVEIGEGTPMDTADLARELYEAYGDDARWRNYQGRPMPQWNELGDQPPIQAHWIAVATHAERLLGKHTADG